MYTRHPSVLFLAMVIVVLAVGASASGQEESYDGSVSVGACTGETIELNGYEKRGCSTFTTRPAPTTGSNRSA